MSDDVIDRPCPGSEITVVAFGGFSGGMGLTPFEFLRVLDGLPVNKVFLRDRARGWYHRGVEGIGRDIESVAQWLNERKGERMVMVGNSAGGYAALLFGSLVGADVHAFSPQTFIDRELRARYGDQRWAAQLDVLPDCGYGDLLPLSERFNIYYDRSDELDRLHAERTGCQLHAFDGGGHLLVARLRDTGQLMSF